jgi:hypothetical protein
VSQTITPPPAPQSGSFATLLSGSSAAENHPIGRVVAALRRGLEGTPGRLRIAAGVAILAAVVAGLGGAAALRDRAAALQDAQDSAANLALLQGVRTNLGQADADAANAFLRFGLEPQAQQRDYAASLQAASKAITAAAHGADDADAKVLGEVNDLLTVYAGDVESARANNRQGFPVGASYLNEASDLMREQILPKLAGVASNEERRTDTAYDRADGASSWLAISVVVGIGGLLAVQVFLAGLSRRVLNLPAVLATGALIVVLIGAASLMAVAQNQADDVREGSYARAAALGQTRVAAFSAKSQEALTLIARGSATTEDQEWRTQYDSALSALRRAGNDADLVTPLEAYGQRHQELNGLDTDGQWDQAVAAATGTGDQTANASFGLFATRSAQALDDAANATRDGLDEARGGLLPLAFVVLLVGLLAAVGAWWGISLRLDEYR